MNFYDIGEIKALAARHGFSFSNSLGQNFLVDRGAVCRIADAAGLGPNDGALEIGPGIGTLTAELAARAGKVCAVELDRAMLPPLGETLAGLANVTLVRADALELDLPALAAERFAGCSRLAAVSNLPYYITTKAVLKLLGSGLFSTVVVMIQKEAARKLTAKAGSPERCLFSLMAEHYASTEYLFAVGRGSFYPQPGVDSAVVRMRARDSGVDEARFAEIARALFASRRKTALNSLTPLLGRDDAAALLAAAHISPSARAEDLSAEEVEALV